MRKNSVFGVWLFHPERAPSLCPGAELVSPEGEGHPRTPSPYRVRHARAAGMECAQSWGCRHGGVPSGCPDHSTTVPGSSAGLKRASWRQAAEGRPQPPPPGVPSRIPLPVGQSRQCLRGCQSSPGVGQKMQNQNPAEGPVLGHPGAWSPRPHEDLFLETGPCPSGPAPSSGFCCIFQCLHFFPGRPLSLSVKSRMRGTARRAGDISLRSWKRGDVRDPLL